MLFYCKGRIYIRNVTFMMRFYYFFYLYLLKVSNIFYLFANGLLTFQSSEDLSFMNNQNSFEGLISEELTAEKQATISGGMNLSIDTLLENEGSFIKDTNANSITLSVDISFIEKNYYPTTAPSPISS